MVTALGPTALGAGGLTALGMNFPWTADLRTFVMASAATGLKIAEVTRLEGAQRLAEVEHALELAKEAWGREADARAEQA